MAGTTLWTQDELAMAFALLLPVEEARTMAARWWAMCANTTDADGRYVHSGPWSEPRVRTEGDAIGDDPAWHTPERVRADEALFADLKDTDAEVLLLRLGDLHFALVALVSPELYERMRVARRMSRRGASRNRLQLTRAVDAYRRSRGWPSAI